MELPILEAGRTTQDITSAFYGRDHRLRIGDGWWYETCNLTSREAPMMATRPRRGTVETNEGFQGMIAKEKLAVVKGGTLYYGGAATPITGLADGEKQLVSMGAFIVIFPDKVYYNTADTTDYGAIESRYTSSGSVSYALCTLTGDPYEDYHTGDTPPADPETGAYWLDTSTGTLKIYNANDEAWNDVPTVYTKITFGTRGLLPHMFSEYDGVTITGSPYPEELDGSKVIYGIGGDQTHDDYIIVVGLIENAATSSSGISIERKLPDMDFVIECRNRLWGCYYGKSSEGETLNEIYCSALGDFKNWRQYQGLATDSWTASVGSDGPWTGAINYLGYPTFFKEARIHRVTVSGSGAHSVIETEARGVQEGSSKSLAIVNEMLIYKARDGVCVYQGGFPTGIGASFGDERYYSAVAGVFGNRCYMSMKDSANVWHLFVYDRAAGFWLREDNTHAVAFAALGDALYCETAEGVLLDLNGTEGAQEGLVEWFAESGTMYYQIGKGSSRRGLPGHKYVSRYDLRLQAEANSEIRIFAQYDDDGVWRYSGKHFFQGVNTIVFPIRPRRCDTMRFRLEGRGAVKLLSITKTVEEGSDV